MVFDAKRALRRHRDADRDLFADCARGRSCGKRLEKPEPIGGEIAQRQGKLRALARVSLPRYVDIDLAGEILALGPGVTEYSIGDRVWGTVDERGSVGAAAEAVAIDTGRVSRMPEGWSAADAVSVLAGAATAVAGLRGKARLRPGERLLVRGGSGGVGSVAVQLGRMYGAHVSALTSRASEQFVRGLGANDVIDYRTSLDAIGVYDVVFDTRGTDLWRLRQHLAPRGRMVAVSFDLDRKVRSLGGIAASSIFGGRCIRFFLGHPSQPGENDIAKWINKRGITLRGIYGRRLCESGDPLMLLLKSGRLGLNWLVTHRLPLSTADEAIDLLTGDAGKVLLVPTRG